MVDNIGQSLNRKTLIDSVASEFERFWRSGQPQTIEEMLVANSDLPRNELLRELVLLEIELSQQDGISIHRADYRRRFPDAIGILEAILDEAGLDEESMATILSSAGDTAPADHTVLGDSAEDMQDEVPEKTTLPVGSGVRPVVVQQPRVIGDYEIIEPIGEGGMGVVYKARQKSLNRLVALKLIRSGITANKEELRRFQTEAEAAAKLNHPNILPVYEFGKHGDSTLYIAMPYIQGKTLRDALGNNTMSPQAAAGLMLTLAKAVAHAHERQILHRDLKPTNILFDEHKNPLVMDFGLACDLSSDDHLTRTSQILGTPQFMPPEQAGQQNGKTDFRSDIYALGAILYYTLRGVAPFTGASGMDVIQRVLNDDPVSPRADDRSIPRDLETICLKCLRKEKKERYQTADELAVDLALFLEGRPILARPLPLLERTVRWCRRRPWQAAIIGLLITFALTATATAGVMTQLRKEERDARQLAEAAALDAQDATLYAHEQQLRAQLAGSDPAEISLGVYSDESTQPSSARSVDNAFIAYERSYSLPKTLNSSAGDWGYFDVRPSLSGKLLAVCDHSGVVQVLDAANGAERYRLANAAVHPEDNWSMHLSFFESEHPRIADLQRPAFTFSLDWLDEETILTVDDQKRLLKYSLKLAEVAVVKEETAKDEEIADTPSTDPAASTNPTATDPAATEEPKIAVASIDPALMPIVLAELSEPGHIVRNRSSDGAILVCLESGRLELHSADGALVADNSDTTSRPMTCQYLPELNSWFVSFENGDVVALDDELQLLARLDTGSTVYEVAMSRHQNRWIADIACAHRPIVRYSWDADARSFTQIAVFDFRSRLHDHYFVACVASANSERLFARDTKGNIVAWNVIGEELLGMFNVTQPSNPWLDGMRVTQKWPAILDRKPSFLGLTSAGHLRAIDDMGVIMEFATDGPPKAPAWKTLETKIGPDPSLAAVNRSPNLYWALDAAGTLSKIDAAAGTILLSVPNAHPGPVPSLVAMNDGRLVTVSGDRTIRVWTTENGQLQEVRRIEHERNLISLAVHEQTRIMAGRIAAMDETAVVSLWDTETGRKVVSASMPEIAYPDNDKESLEERNAKAAASKILTPSTRPYTGKLAFNPTGQYLAAFGVGQQFDILDCRDRLKAVAVGGSYEDAGAQGGTSLCWSGTNDWRLIAGDEFGTAGVWIAEKEPATHTSRISQSIAFRGHPVDCRQTPDKGRLCLLMRDGRLLFITSAHFVPTTMLDTGVRNANSIAIGSTGQTLMVAGRDGILRSAVFADFSLPDDTTLKTLKGTRHQLLSEEENRFVRPVGHSPPSMTPSGKGTIATLIVDNPASQDGEPFLIRRREKAWKLDPIKIPNSPGTDGSHVFSESMGIAFSRDERPVVALRQELPGGSYNGRLLLTREQADGSWETEVVLNAGNEGHTCFPILDAMGEANSILHFDWGIMRFRQSRRGPLIDGQWPTLTLAKGRGFRLNGIQSEDGTVHVCGNSIRGSGDYAPHRYLAMKPGEPLHWENAPGQTMTSMSDGTPVIINTTPREAACGNIYRRQGTGWEVWTRIPGSFSDQCILSHIFITKNNEIWLADYRQAAKRLFAWRFRNNNWTCYEVEAQLPERINMIHCWVETEEREEQLVFLLSGFSLSEVGTMDVIDMMLPSE